VVVFSADFVHFLTVFPFSYGERIHYITIAFITL